MTETGMNASNPLAWRAPRRHGRPGAARGRASRRRRGGPGARGRRDRRARGPRPERLQGLLAPAGEDPRRVPRRTASSSPATSRASPTDGYVTIVGRAKDLIISGGLNVYPKEIESVIDALDGVAESAVIGVPHAGLRRGRARGRQALGRRRGRGRGDHRRDPQPARRVQMPEAGRVRRRTAAQHAWARCRRTCCATPTATPSALRAPDARRADRPRPLRPCHLTPTPPPSLVGEGSDSPSLVGEG